MKKDHSDLFPGFAAEMSLPMGGNYCEVPKIVSASQVVRPSACTHDGGACSVNSDCCSGDCDFSNGSKVCWPK